MSTKYNEQFSTNEQGHLTIGNVDTVTLAKNYGTPLYVYDVARVRENARLFTGIFKSLGIPGQVAYASKAFSTIAMLQVLKQEGLCLDVVSTGELYTAVKAGFPGERIHLHGNNKSADEFLMAIEQNIGCVVLDNFHDISLLETALEKHDEQMDVLIRVTPGVTSATHQYIMTGHEDSKFGFDLYNGQADKAFTRLLQHPKIHLKGLHCHIGSQITTSEDYTSAGERLFSKIREWHEQFGYEPAVMNFGGGFGIRYTPGAPVISYQEIIKSLVKTVRHQVEQIGITFPEIWIEPGRAIVGNAGVTLYTIGSRKDIPGVKSYIAVDGGMTDNIRPALYNAEYHGVIANKAEKETTEMVSVAGKCCESGDVLIDQLAVASPEQGDILAVYATGAYGYSMASNYNRYLKPAVVFVENERHQIVVNRETLDDIVKHDLSYE